MPMFFTEPKNTNADNTLTGGVLDLGTFAELEGSDYLYMRMKGVTGYTATLAGHAVESSPFGAGYDGYQYVMIAITLIGGSMTISFTGTNIELDKVYVMEKLFEFPDEDTFIKIDMGRSERGAVTHEDLYSQLSKVTGYFKRDTGFTAERQTKQKLREFELFYENPDHSHLLFMESFIDFPDRVYHAIMGPDFSHRYSVSLKDQGFDIDFRVTER